MFVFCIEELSANNEAISFSSETVSVTLMCELAGYLTSNSIQWRRNDNNIVPIPAKYEIVDSEGDIINTISENGIIRKSIVSRLIINNLVEDDSGIYHCLSNQDSLNINLSYIGKIIYDNILSINVIIITQFLPVLLLMTPVLPVSVLSVLSVSVQVSVPVSVLLQWQILPYYQPAQLLLLEGQLVECL